MKSNFSLPLQYQFTTTFQLFFFSFIFLAFEINNSEFFELIVSSTETNNNRSMELVIHCQNGEQNEAGKQRKLNCAFTYDRA